MNSLDNKIIDVFGDLTIDKAAVRQLNIREARTIPSFVEEWLISRYQHPDKEPTEVYKEISDFMSKYLPMKSEKEVIKNKLLQGDIIVLLDKFSVRIDIQRGRKLLTIPSLDESTATITDHILNMHETLLSGGQWGAGRLRITKENNGKNAIELIEFRPMQSGRVKLDKMIEARTQFTTEEWIFLLLRTMGYEPIAYSENSRLNLILRLLPIVHKNINMMELAPKGTGKSFVYTNLSRYVWLNSGGALTQAQLFMNLNTKEVGLLARHDLLVLDEGQSINFKGADDIHAKFKDYLESGRYSVGGREITSECGLMVLANIDLSYDQKPRRPDFIRHLPEMFHDDAFIDRFHGIIPGWEIPRFTTDRAAQGVGIKADIFGEYAHQLRAVSNIEFPYGQTPDLKGDSRDVKSVSRLATALSKLLLLNPGDSDYEKYVIQPAKGLRERVRSQLAALNPHEFSPKLKLI